MKVGDEKVLVKEPVERIQLVKYAGASGDFNRIHYDEPFAKAGGFPSVIAHGMLSMGFFGQLVRRERVEADLGCHLAQLTGR